MDLVSEFLDIPEYEKTDTMVLRDRFMEPPFSVLDTKTGSWQKRKNAWKSLGIQSEVGRSAKTFNMNGNFAGKNIKLSDTSIFDPALCEVIYHWFCEENGSILDPFAGGSVRGIVASYLGYNYSGIDIRQEQIESNYEQANRILDNNVPPIWLIGDSNKVLETIEDNSRDLIFSCPPYVDLEVYSELEGDISNMDYKNFMVAYRSIIKKSCDKLKSGGYAIFVVGEVRDKKGNYLGFVPDTIKAFSDCDNINYYNEAILLNPVGTASLRANGNMKSNKLVKIHQNVLIFKKD